LVIQFDRHCVGIVKLGEPPTLGNLEQAMLGMGQWSYIAILMALAQGAAAFTFADGTSVACEANGKRIQENVIDPGQAQLAFTGRTVQVNDSYQIVWNEAKLNALPPDVHDYLFFHECAHVKVPTKDEVMANCSGLKDMRAAGRAGPAVEARLTAFYGAGNTYWMRTLKCANEEP
jgi:hypothetical protein